MDATQYLDSLKVQLEQTQRDVNHATDRYNKLKDLISLLESNPDLLSSIMTIKELNYL